MFNYYEHPAFSVRCTESFSSSGRSMGMMEMINRMEVAKAMLQPVPSKLKVFTDDKLTKNILTRKQTRKFKNKRWVKKYRKKYSKIVPDSNAYVFGGKLVCHPEVLERLKQSENVKIEGGSICDMLTYTNLA